MKKPLSFLLPAVALCAVALFSLTLSCKKEDAQGGDAIYAIELNKTELQLALDETFALTATVPSPEQSIVTWWSSDPEIVSVDEASGLLTALKDEGEVTITATVSSKRPVQPRATATCAVSVVTNYSLSLDYSSVNMQQEGTKSIYAIPVPESGYGKIEWVSNNTSIVKVRSSEGPGTVLETQKTNGTAKVTAKLYSRFDSATPKATAVCEVEVKSYFVDDLGLPDRVDMVMGTKQTLVPGITPPEVAETKVDYEVTSGGDYVSVNAVGELTPKKVSGTSYAVVKATARDSHKCTKNIKVYVAEKPVYPTGLTVTGFVSETYPGQTFDPVLTFTPTNTNQKDYTVTSSNTSVASVSKNSAGYHVYAKASGTATITVTYNTSATTQKTDTRTVNVFAGPPRIAWTNSQSAELAKGMIVGKTLTVTAKVSNKSNTAVTYTSSNTDVVTVSASGVITAKGRGKAWVTAKSQADPSLTVSTVAFDVYGVPATITCVSGNTNPIFLRYGNVTTKKMEFQVKDANGYLSRQDLTVAITGLVNIYPSTALKSGGAELTLSNHRTSATSTIKGSMMVCPLGYSSVKLTYDVYDAMYDKNDPKPFDGIGILNDKGQFAFCDGGYRGSGYFEDVSSSFKDCIAIIFWVGEHPKTGISMLKNLHGHSFSSRPLIHGLAVATQNARKSADEDLVKWWTVSQKQGDAVNLSSQYTGFWNSGNPGYGYTSVSTTNTGLYGYEITRGMKFYNEKVKSNAKYTVIPVKNIVDYMPETHPENNYNSGWYLPTSGEWYRMLHCLEGATVEQTRDKINEYINKTSGWTTIGGSIEYWSCQEAADAPDGSAVYMTGNSATEAGKKPTRYKEKQETCKVRPFIAF